MPPEKSPTSDSFALQEKRVQNKRVIDNMVCAEDGNALVERHLLHTTEESGTFEDWIIVCPEARHHRLPFSVMLRAGWAERNAQEHLDNDPPMSAEALAANRKALFGE